MTSPRPSWALTVLLVVLAACGDPNALDMSSSVVKEGQTGAYAFKLRDDRGRLYARDGTLGVSYRNGAGQTRCQGEAAVSAKDQGQDGEFHVQIPFKPPCSAVKTAQETRATYTFKPAKGALLTLTPSYDSSDLTDWDTTQQLVQRYANEAEEARPAVIAEKQRFQPLAALVPAPSGQLPLTRCPGDVAAALQKDPPARLSYDDLLRFASRQPEPGHEQLGFLSEGIHSVMAGGDPLYAAGDARMPSFRPPAYVEVSRVSAYTPYRIITAGDTRGTFEDGELFADVSIIAIASKQAVCGGSIAVQPDEKITDYPSDLSVQKNLAQNYRAARTALESKLVGGAIPPTP